MSKPFVHLHLHTAYSILDGACRIEELIQKAVDCNMPAVAMTDHGVMYGVVEFQKAAQEAGIRPIIGCEMYITTGSRKDRDPASKRSTHHLTLLAENNVGYRNLSQLVSKAHLEGFYYKPRIDHELLAEHAEGLIGMSACLRGEVADALKEDNLSEAEAAAIRYRDILGKNNFFIEIMDHGLIEQRKANRHMKELSERTGIPLVATNDVHYLNQSDSAAHEVMLCLQTGTTLSDPNRMRYNSDQFYFRTAEEMYNLFPDMPDAVARTAEIADRCFVEIELGQLHFPTYKVPGEMTQKEYLIQIGHKGLQELYNVADPANPANDREREIMQRFDMEVGIIEHTGFINYFLVVWDFIRFAHENKIPVGPGRGSGGGSIVAYSLGIISIDPLQYNLIFERFLNPERVSPPDFDIDFCQARRDEVIQYVKEKYGADHVAQIITFGSLGAKSVLRDVGRVLEIPFGKCDEFAKMIPDDPKITIERALNENPEFKQASQNDEQLKAILKHAKVLEGLYRNPGTHAAGVVIGEKPLIDICPLAVDKDKQPVTQFAKEPVEEIGLLKMDFLGLKTLTVIQEAIELIAEGHNVEIDFKKIPFDDPKTYELLSRADTVGVFQLESGGMRDLIRRIGINNIEEIIAVIALYRPGPMNMLPSYISRKTGQTEIEYDHPLLEPILKDTYGVMVYQEQVQKAANVLAGYSLAEADILRRAMGKKKPKEMESQRVKFIKGCKTTNNMPPEQAKRIFDNIASFAGYGFNKAHSAGYAIVCYQTAYLKANYPAEFMCALISSEIGNFDKMPGFIREATDMGLQVLPPHVNHSGIRFTPEGQGIRYGLACMKNVGAGAAASIIAEREKNGPFEDLLDFCSRIDTSAVNKKVMETLARSGALDFEGMHRARTLHALDFAVARSAATQADRAAGQSSLFDLLDGNESSDTPSMEEIPDCPPWSETVALAAERELLGVYMSGHPLSHCEYLLKLYETAKLSKLNDYENGNHVRIGGLASAVIKRTTKKKETMAILQLEDLNGTIEVLVWPDTYIRYAPVLQQDAILLVCGTISVRKDKATNLIAREIYPLQDAPTHFAQSVSIHVTTPQIEQHLEKLKEIISLHPGHTPVSICVLFPDGHKLHIKVDVEFHVLPDAAFVKAIEQLIGEHTVFVHVSQQPMKQMPQSNGRFGNRRSSTPRVA